MWRHGYLDTVHNQWSAESGPQRLGIDGEDGLNCGARLDVWDDSLGRWRRGRVEHSGAEGWYWVESEDYAPLHGDKPSLLLRAGMRVRRWSGLRDEMPPIAG